MNATKSSGQPSGQSMPALSAAASASRMTSSSAPRRTLVTIACPASHSTSATAVLLASAARSTPTVSTLYALRRLIAMAQGMTISRNQGSQA